MEETVFFYSKSKEICIRLKAVTLGALITESHTDAFQEGIKKVPEVLPRFMQLAFTFKLLGHTLTKIHAYKFKVEYPNIFIAKYGHIHRSKNYSKYTDHKTISYRKFKQGAKTRLNKKWINFGLKGYKLWRQGYPDSKDEVKPENFGMCLYKYKDFIAALKCFKDKDTITVKYPAGVMAKNYWLCLSSKEEDIEVELCIDTII
jgi:hypothetical protein